MLIESSLTFEQARTSSRKEGSWCPRTSHAVRFCVYTITSGPTWISLHNNSGGARCDCYFEPSLAVKLNSRISILRALDFSSAGHKDFGAWETGYFSSIRTSGLPNYGDVAIWAVYSACMSIFELRYNLRRQVVVLLAYCMQECARYCRVPMRIARAKNTNTVGFPWFRLSKYHGSDGWWITQHTTHAPGHSNPGAGSKAHSIMHIVGRKWQSCNLTCIFHPAKYSYWLSARDAARWLSNPCGLFHQADFQHSIDGLEDCWGGRDKSQTSEPPDRILSPEASTNLYSAVESFPVLLAYNNCKLAPGAYASAYPAR